MRVFKYTLCAHDFLFYVARELVGGVPTDIISNTALLYAFNTHSGVHRNASGTSPHYREDAELFTMYPTPAELYSKNEIVIGDEMQKWDAVSRELKKLTYNSVQTLTQTTDVGHMCHPMIGHYLKYRPLTPFT
ncbi:MAG: hypothetical protein ACXQT1_04385, partial [Methermicoccaceae archaeon]